MYYVYEWYIVETGEIIYVGKGIHKRYKVRKHNKFFNDMIERFECESRIVKVFDFEKDAFKYEYDRIKELKEIGQCVCNIYNGGTGGSTNWWTEKQREKYSEFNVMKSEKQRKRMSQNNPMFNKEISQKVNAKKRKPVIIGGIEYESVKKVCDTFGVYSSAVNEWCIRGKTPNGEDCHYKNQTGLFYNLKNNGQKKPLRYKCKHYGSATEASKELGVAQTTISRWCRNGFDPYGNPCKYDDDERNEFKPITEKRISVIVNGKWYPSKEAARKELGITTYTLTKYLDGKMKDEKYICKYDNQQPSRGNTDKSTSEGSTTNG